MCPSGCEPGQRYARPLRHPLQRPNLGLGEVRGPARKDGEELPLRSRGEETQVCRLPITAHRTVSPLGQHAQLECQFLSSKALKSVLYLYHTSIRSQVGML